VKSVPIEDLRDVGSTIARRLRNVGICTRADLEKVGPVAAYRRICSQEPGMTIPVCYYLYSPAACDRREGRIGHGRSLHAAKRPRLTLQGPFSHLSSNCMCPR
jgi:hypothetical protein